MRSLRRRPRGACERQAGGVWSAPAERPASRNAGATARCWSSTRKQPRIPCAPCRRRTYGWYVAGSRDSGSVRCPRRSVIPSRDPKLGRILQPGPTTVTRASGRGETTPKMLSRTCTSNWSTLEIRTPDTVSGWCEALTSSGNTRGAPARDRRDQSGGSARFALARERQSHTPSKPVLAPPLGPDSTTAGRLTDPRICLRGSPARSGGFLGIREGWGSCDSQRPRESLGELRPSPSQAVDASVRRRRTNRRCENSPARFSAIRS